MIQRAAAPGLLSLSRAHSIQSVLRPFPLSVPFATHEPLPAGPLVFARAFHRRRGLRAWDIDKAAKKDQDAAQEEVAQYDKAVAEDKEKQVRTPWMREGSDRPPVGTGRSASAMTKGNSYRLLKGGFESDTGAGKLLTTPSRLMKLILPLTTRDFNSDRKSVEPLALLVHPQQPLSYLERLIQSELPLIEANGTQQAPSIHFRAVDAMAEDSMEPEKYSDESRSQTLRKGPGEGGVESYSGAGRERDDADQDEDLSENFVRWSKSTEIGDFIRDAARGKEFGIEIEGAPREVRIGVPSFQDRTYYLRMRLRKRAQVISQMAELKKECDHLAHRGAQRVAMAGFGGMTGWGVMVGFLTFYTDLGWDVMEPVTYLAGLAGLLGGYGKPSASHSEAILRSTQGLTLTGIPSMVPLQSARGELLERDELDRVAAAGHAVLAARLRPAALAPADRRRERDSARNHGDRERV